MATARGLPSLVLPLLTLALLSLLLAPHPAHAVSQQHVTCASHRQLVSCTLCASLPGVAVTQAQCCDSALLLQTCLSCLVDSSRCHNLLTRPSGDADRDKRFRVWWPASKTTSARESPKLGAMSTYMKRPKYFLGKRARAKVDKRRNRNTFLGKRGAVDYSALAKRRGPFLGKRQVKPFLGKRSVADSAENM